MNDESMPQAEACVAVASQEICIDADVEVEPVVRAGHTRTKCVGPPMVDGCECCRKHKGEPGHGCDCDCGPCCKPTCHFSVRQVICVTVPLIFDAKVEAQIARARCGAPKPGPCSDESRP